jgi:TPR repeat protein
MYNLGIMYYNNRNHKTYDNKSILDEAMNPGAAHKKRMLQAYDWFKKAADKNDEKAMYAIGLMYKNGEGVDKSLAEARKWFQKAADKGNADAKEELKKL